MPTETIGSAMTISEFCELHNACIEGREWALANCETMEEVWATARPEWILWIATRRGVLTDRELRLFAVWSARHVQHLMTDQRSVAALDVAERHANGEATDKELAAAESAAWMAVMSAADAVGRAVMSAANAAERAAGRAVMSAAKAAERAQWMAAWSAADAAESAHGLAAWKAAYAAEMAAKSEQSSYLRSNTAPNFAQQEVTR